MLYKRPGSPFWFYRFRLAGQEVRRSTQTASRKLAEQIEQAARETIIRLEKLGEAPAVTYVEARERWLQDRATKRSVTTDKYLFRSMDEYFEGSTVDQMDAEAIRKYGQLIAQRASPATANRHIDLIRAMLKRLEKWGMIPKAPVIERYSVEQKEPVWASKEQIDKLLSELPDHARAVVRFAVTTGLRRSNVVGLRWDWINLDRKVAFIPASKAKGKRTIPVPLSDDAMTILEAQRGKHPEYVFVDHFGRAPMHDVRTAWEQARVRAGLPTFRFHDLRHTWASWHVQAGTPSRILQELGGWAEGRMVQRYAHLGLEHLAGFVNNGQK